MSWRHREPSAAKRGYDNDWRKVRTAHLAAVPYCIRCGDRATEVNHRVPKAEGGTNAHSNLESLCRACHHAETNGHAKRAVRPPEQHPGSYPGAAEKSSDEDPTTDTAANLAGC